MLRLTALFSCLLLLLSIDVMSQSLIGSYWVGYDTISNQPTGEILHFQNNGQILIQDTTFFYRSDTTSGDTTFFAVGHGATGPRQDYAIYDYIIRNDSLLLDCYYDYSASRKEYMSGYNWTLSGLNLPPELNETVIIELFPNPLNTELVVEINEEGIFSFTIINAAGRISNSGDFRGGKNNIDIFSLSKGIYYIIIPALNYSQRIAKY